MKKKLQNWLYYNIWWVAAIALLAVIVSSMVLTRVKAEKQRFDYCIAYVATQEIPAEGLEELKCQFAALGADVDGDGEITVKINQYIPGASIASGEEAAHGRVAEVALLTDISEMESYLFLVEYPEDFQLDFQLMAHLDGSPSANDDFGVWDKVFAWNACPALAGMELGSWEDENGTLISGQALMSKLYVGRRCFIQKNAEADSPENEAFWQAVTKDGTPVEEPKA